MKTKEMLFKVAGIGLLACALGLPTQAVADPNGMIIIMDQTGSMTSNLTIGTTTRPTYEWARDEALIELNLTAQDREFELWSFQHTSSVNPYEILFSFEDGESMSVYERQQEIAYDINNLPTPDGTTPLTTTICEAIDEIVDWASSQLPPPEKRIKIYTDGENNDTPTTDQCYGPSSVAIYDKNNPDRGGLDVGSWQWKVLNKAITGDPNNTGNPPVQVIVDVTGLFRTTGSAYAATSVEEVVEKAPSGKALYSYASSVSADAAFFAGLAESTGGKYVQIDPATPPPVTGDADDDGCVGFGDYYQIIGDYGPVTSANKDSDLNSDQVVDYYDVLVVIQHWGTPC